MGTQTTQALATSATLLGLRVTTRTPRCLGLYCLLATVKHLLHAVQNFSGLHAGVHLVLVGIVILTALCQGTSFKWGGALGIG